LAHAGGLNLYLLPSGGRHSIWNSYAPICRYVAQIVVEVAVNVRRIFIALVMKLHFPNHKRSELRAPLTVVAVLARGVLVKLDATIQLFHTSH
jgi:hypothetical protein